MFEKFQLQHRAQPPSPWTNRIANAIKIGLALFPFGFGFWFLANYFVLSGTYVVDYNFCKPDKEISRLLPWTYIGEIVMESSCYQPVVGTPITFDVKAPRWFNRATVKIEFDPKDQPVMDFSLRRRDLITYDEQPMVSALLEDSAWNILEENGIKLYQKEKDYPNLASFINDGQTHLSKNIATYHYSLKIPKLLPGYQAQPDHLITINKALRGAHRFSVYLKDEPFDITISKQDLNDYPGRDPLLIQVRYFDELIDAIVIDDDGNDLGGGITRGDIQSARILKENLPEGPYEIHLNTTDDVLIRSIVIGNDRLVFHDKLFLADNEEYFKDLDLSTQPTSLITSASQLRFSTSHPNGFQTVQVNGAKVEINQINQFFSIQDLDERSNVFLPKNDLMMETSGNFAFAEDQWFDPLPSNIYPLSDRPDATFEKIDYAIARYTPPTKVGSNLQSIHVYDLHPFLSDDFQFRAMMTFPGLDEREGEVTISRIEVILQKPPVTLNNLWERAQNVMNRSL